MNNILLKLQLRTQKIKAKRQEIHARAYAKED